MGKVNTWYVVGYKNEKCPFGYSQLTPKGKYFKTLKEARKQKKKHEWVEVVELVIMRRTCEVLK